MNIKKIFFKRKPSFEKYYLIWYFETHDKSLVFDNEKSSNQKKIMQKIIILKNIPPGFFLHYVVILCNSETFANRCLSQNHACILPKGVKSKPLIMYITL
jgi:hypothetical protein